MKKILPLSWFAATVQSMALALLVLFPSLSIAHEHGPCSRAHRAPAASLLLPDIHERRPYDVLSYELTLDWRRPFIEKAPVYSGIQVMKVRITQPTKVIVIDASLILMDSAWIDGKRYTIAPIPTNDQFRFSFDEVMPVGQDVTIKMAFTRYSKANQGVYFFPKGSLGDVRQGDSVFTEEDIIYTQSEPLDGQFWMPCMNLPYDKADVRISIRVPDGIKGISNGLLTDSSKHVDGSTTYYWVSDKPMANYLMVANASNYVEWDEKYARPSDPSDSVRAIYYAWLKDYNGVATDGSEYNARHAFRNTTRILTAFSKLIGEYPFEQYGQVPVQPYYFGGMEHQGMTTVNRNWLRGRSEGGIAHEIGHQWFGDKVTCETWDDLWLNEGFATYTEALWAESWGGIEWYFNTIQGTVNGYFEYGLHSASIFGPPAMQAFQLPYSPLVYNKASAVLHLMRRYVNNDTLFFNAIRDYTDAFAYSTVTTAKFEDYMTTRLGLDLSQFFDQWVYGPGHPIYTAKWDSDNGKLFLRIEQEQTEDVFEAPLRFFIVNADQSIDTVVVDNDERIQQFSFNVIKPIGDLVFDPDYSVLSLREINHDETLTVGEAAPQQIEFSHRNNELSIYSASTFAGTVSIVDLLGRRVVQQEILGSRSENISTLSLPAGSYFVTLDSYGVRTTFKFVK